MENQSFYLRNTPPGSLRRSKNRSSLVRRHEHGTEIEEFWIGRKFVRYSAHCRIKDGRTDASLPSAISTIIGIRSAKALLKEPAIIVFGSLVAEVDVILNIHQPSEHIRRFAQHVTRSGRKDPDRLCEFAELLNKPREGGFEVRLVMELVDCPKHPLPFTEAGRSLSFPT